MSHTPSDAITADSKINRAATSARALAALAESCFMEERLTQILDFAHCTKPPLPEPTSPLKATRPAVLA
jgi:hypothetical protein